MKRGSILIAIAFLVLPIWGQSSPTGLPPFGTFQNGQFDTVNLNNLNVEFSIPLFSIPGRGLALSPSIGYNSGFWTVSSGAWAPWVPASNIPGWTPNNFDGQFTRTLSGYYCAADKTNTTEYHNFQVTEPNGTVHTFNVDYFTPMTTCSQYQKDTETGFALDSSGWYMDGKNFKAYSPSGVVLSSSIGYYATDPNGNYIHQTGQVCVGCVTTESYADTLNRTVAITPNGSTVWNYTYKDSNGTTQTYALHLQQFTVQTNFGCSVVEFGPYSQYMPVSLVLPNGSSYTFQYEPTPGHSGSVTGRISEVTLPTGGTYQYTYGPMECSLFEPTSLTRKITNGISVSTWQYSRAYAGGTTTTTVTDPQMPYDSASNQRVVTFVPGQSCTYSPPTCLIETDKQYQGSTSGTLLKTVQTVFQPQTVYAPTPGITTMTLPDNQQKQVVTSYDRQGRLLAQDDYDWGNGGRGSHLRNITNTYLNSPTYIALGLSNRLASTVIQNGAGTTVAQTQFEYDNYTQGISASGAVQHNSSYGTGYTTRGNVTAVERWRNTDGAWLTTRFQFDDAGNILSSTDPNSHTTSTGFGDSWANSTCAPSGGSAAAYPTTLTNALGQTETIKYNSCTGTPASTTDANSQTTTYAYDEMGRTTQVVYPDTGQTTYTYNDAAPPSMTTTMKMNSTQNLSATTLFDDLGEVHETQQTDPEGTDYTDISYDAIGRVYTVSNPYRSASDSTYGNTTYEYDALSRPTYIIDQDGSKKSSSYSGNCTTTTDEAGKAKKSCSDELERTAQVFEDPSGSNYETDYSYDAIGDLTGVLQGGRQLCQANGVWYSRCFAYDSLGEVTQAVNPESGTTSYAYDNDGNVTSRVAPAPNQTGSATVTTTYTYDALNRLTGKSYSDGTPSPYYWYDVHPTWGMSQVTNVVGRLVEASFNSGTSASVVNSYDAMGRVNFQWLQTPPVSPGGYYFYYSYNQVGDLSSETNAAGIQISYAYDSAAHLSNVTSSFVDANHPATLWTADSTQGYYPNGALEKAVFGNSITETNAVEPRLQPCRIEVNNSGSVDTSCTDSLPSGTIQSYQYVYGAWDVTNNGDVTGFGATGAQNFNRSYTFDSLDRLSTMSAPGDACSGLSWNYDQWGNRTDQNATGGTCGTFHATVGTNNRLGSPYQYDAAGNMTYDGTHSYTYDAENRVIAVDGGSTATYVYDALGRRVQKIVSGVSTQYYYDPSGNVIADYDDGCGVSCWSHGYVYVNGQLKVEYANSTTYFVHPDLLGSTRLLTGYPTPSIIDCDDYYPFGESIPCGSNSDLRYKFTGQERDDETLLDNFKARYVSSAMGRFMTPDPLGNFVADPTVPQSWNMYSYVLNNPLKFVDRTGYDWCQWDDGSHDDSPDDGGASELECEEQGGTWIPTLNQSISVDGETGQTLFWEDAWIPNTVVLQTQQPDQGMSYAECVKEGGNAMSVQHGIQYLSGGHVGNGWVSGALFGNPFSGAIQTAQDASSHNWSGFSSNGANTGLGLAGANIASAAQKRVPNVTVAISGAISVQAANSTGVTTFTAGIDALVPVGQIAKGALDTVASDMARLGNVLTLPVSITGTAFSAVVCSVGR